MLHGAWTEFADAVLSQEALLARVRFGDPNPMAGLHVAAGELDKIIDELTSGDLADAVRDEWADAVGEARQGFIEELGGDSPFAALVRHAGLGVEEAEVFALVCAT